MGDNVNRDINRNWLLSPQVCPQTGTVGLPCSPLSLEGFLFLGAPMSRYEWWIKRGRIYRNHATLNLVSKCLEEHKQSILQKIEKYQPQNKEDWTPAEKKFSEALISMGILHDREKPIPCGRTVYFADFFLRCPLYLVIEIDGGIHKSQMEYDANRDDEIRKMTGWDVFRFNNEEIMNSEDHPEKWKMFFDMILEICRLEKYSVDWVYELRNFERFIRDHCPELLKVYWKGAKTPMEARIEKAFKEKKKKHFKRLRKLARLSPVQINQDVT